jgi:hypothetical protein
MISLGHHSYPVNVNTAPDYLLRFLCGDDDRAYEELLDKLSGRDTTSGETFFRNAGDRQLSSLRANRSIELGSECKIFRIHVTVRKGAANFRLHALLGHGRSSSGGATATTPRSPRVPNTRTSKTKSGSPLDKNFAKLQYPFHIIALRENENLVD